MERCEILVIGGGAAGMMAAIKGAEHGASVVVLEKKSLCGRKIMVTGKGRCNITNNKPWSEFSEHIHPKANFAKAAFRNFSNEATVAYFNEIGLPTKVTQGGRIFPESMSAASVVDALVNRMKALGVKVFNNCDVISLLPVKDGSYLCNYNYIKKEGEQMDLRGIVADTVIIATGGLSYPLTGSTGYGYELAKRLGHTVTRCFPSLTALVPHNYDIRLIGIGLENVGLYLTIDGYVAQIENGDVDFTEGGIEGSLGFRVSRKAVNAMVNGSKVEVVIDLKPALSLEKLQKRVDRDLEAMNWSHAESTEHRLKIFLRDYLPAQIIAPFIFAHKGVTLKTLPQALKEWRFPLLSYVGYQRAVVTAGGVSTDEIVSKSMQSRIAPGLFFAGEVIDVDCDTGGYKL
ncbi:MAG: aminoacetone oxidase family FAD-binding enzyme, partial [Bacteroidales bacterium]|nr:aminoacetone oxidase family FAD-binding enzyme [Bacteroidales bacterium]